MTLLLIACAMSVLLTKPDKLLEALEPLPKVPPMPYKPVHRRRSHLEFDLTDWALWASIWFLIGLAMAGLVWGNGHGAI